MSLSYETLDTSEAQIRVLVVHSSPPGPTPGVRCTLEVVSLNAKPSFAALSYVWGDPNITRSIQVNGMEIQVTKNLHDALQWFTNHVGGTLSSCLERRVLWADAICINQHDLEEKAHQINLMSRIYKDANTVVCWLGQSPPPLVNTYLKRRTSLAQPIMSPRWKRVASWAIMLAKSWYHTGSRIGAVQECLEIIGGQTEFLQLGYSTRIWTFQEVLIPRSNQVLAVLDGDIVPGFDPRKVDVITFPTLVVAIMVDLAQQEPEKLSLAEKQAVALFQSPAVAKADSVLGKAVWRQMWLEEHNLTTKAGDSPIKEVERGDGKLKLWELLLATADRLCYDPRDKVFALLGLLKDRDPDFLMQGGEELLAVDYTKPPAEVVLDALYYVHKYESPALVLFVCTQYKPRWWADGIKSGVPSWLPDLSKPRSTVFSRPKLPGSILRHVHLEWMRRENGSGDKVACEARPIGQIAVVCSFVGTSLDIINKVAHIIHLAGERVHKSSVGGRQTTKGPRRSGEEATSAPLAELREDRMGIRDLVSRLRMDINLPKRLTHILIGNGDKNMALASRVAQYGTEIWSILQQAAQKSETGDFLAQKEQTALLHGDLIATNLQGSALIVLEDGRFGICANVVEAGDAVFFSNSFRNTVVLRPVEPRLTREHREGAVNCSDPSDDVRSSNRRLRDHGTFMFVDHLLIDTFTTWGNVDNELAGELSRLDSETVIII